MRFPLSSLSLLVAAAADAVLVAAADVDPTPADRVLADRSRGPKPKMIAEEPAPDRPGLFGRGRNPGRRSETMSSNNAIYVGDCSPGSPFRFPLGSRPERGAVGARCDVASSLAVGSGDRDVSAVGGLQRNFISAGGPEDFCGYAFVGDGGSGDDTAEVSCPAGDTPVVVIMRDEDGDAPGSMAAPAEADVSCGRGGEMRLQLKGDAARRSKASLHGQTRARGGRVAARGRGGASRATVAFGAADDKSIVIKSTQDVATQGEADDAGLSLIQATLDDGEGKIVRRTFVTEMKKCKGRAGSKRRLHPITISSSSINEEGDIELHFDLDELLSDRPDDDARLKVQARVGIAAAVGDDPEAEGASEILHRTVDVSALLSREHPAIVVHGGWIRRALSSADAPRGWDVVVEEAVVSDPEAGYEVVAHMEDVHPTGVGSHRARRALLAGPPSEEELGVTEEMRRGRRPERGAGRGARALQSGSHKKILVHGYCADSSPFRFSQFSDAVEFSDPDGRRRLGGNNGGNNWSNDVFARKIDKFSEQQGIYGCGLIAHSQGGLASAHLKEYYWSCLDYADRGDSRLIQSVGSPYQGTNLAGILAGVGGLVGVGCGTNADLTYDGAARWLGGISGDTRREVNYYTTSFEDKWWRYDFCQIASDLVLADPDDGTTEKARGQLPGARNRGHAEKQCHTEGMRDPEQTKDGSRNREMNRKARY